MSTNKQSSDSERDAFSLLEVLIASAISTVVLMGVVVFFVSTFNYWHRVNLRMDADTDVNIAMSRLVYGVAGSDRLGLRAAAAETVKIVRNGDDWTISYETGSFPPQKNSFTYSKTDRSLVFNPGDLVVGRDIKDAEVGRDGAVMTIKLCAEKKRGKMEASREIETKINFRNRNN